VLYISIGDANEHLHELQKRAEGVYPHGGAFFLHAANTEAELYENVQAIKAQIQKNHAKLNLMQVHVYLVATAHQITLKALTEFDIVRLRTWLSRDFAVPFIMLCTLYAWGEAEASQAFLLELPKFTPVCDHIFILSDRYQNNEVRPAHWAQLYELIIRLPMAFGSVEEKFLTAGLLMPDLPAQEASMPEAPPPDAPHLPEILPESIVNHLQSIAAQPLHIFQLRGLSLDNAEAKLFGNRMRRFFEENYLQSTSCEIQHGSAPVTAWRVSTAIRSIAQKYASFYRSYRVKTLQATQKQQEDYTRSIEEAKKRFASYRAQSVARLQNAPPPPVALYLLRTDGLPEKIFFPDDNEPCVLRIMGGFSVEDIF